ncbi:Ribosomal protein arginine N-methyltransferase rmt3 [Purpureocillium lavendulum]|uniref:type I protein arginine methyltransferase n=1 Tax=Purpureocillium lavendulum TaxID=1247861 RepID=A0AB34FSN1_9HYPO|nr:Ribosomal protein arginine N-methyltransferase rmt3 [Purpureocillium lavendulum]
MFSLSTAPAKQQSVSETITVLSGRLSSATLLEDRRAAIQGLRSFSKDFPASVASGALRSLIGSLGKDGDDVDTVKVVLETLLMLFNPNPDSPEASDEIVLWLADEFTQRQDNITLLLDFVDSPDFYSRLYALQLLTAILAARTQRTEECVFTAPLGISRLVAALDDDRDAIRNEAISLLTALTPTSVEIQKLVAFENAFEKLFNIVDADGALYEGGRTVEDCLILLANLLRRNASNQSLFRESGCIRNLAVLVQGLLEARLPAGEDVAAWAEIQRNRNIYAFLAVIRLFLPLGATGLLQNQNALWKQGLVHDVLQLAFRRDVCHIPIRAEAFVTCGDMIRNSTPLQESFAQLTVPSPLEGATPEAPARNGEQQTVYVIDGLLDLILNTQDQRLFDLRFSACECLKAYLSNHSEVRIHFLGRAIEGYLQGPNESANVLTVLLRPDASVDALDPYRQWFAAVITFHLLQGNDAAKAKALALTEGDAEKGEEVVTSIQTIAAHLISGVSRDEDPRPLVGYLMLLLGWMFEDMDAVNDFLAEGSNVQSLIQAVLHPKSIWDGLVQGLIAMLLGVAYEFSTKDSPIPRSTLHSVLTSRLGSEVYRDSLTNLRSHPLVRDFEVTPQKHDPSSPSGLAGVFFDAVFVEFLKDNYSRILRAVDRAPEFEISVITNGVQKGISRELVDSLRSQVEDKDQVVQEAKARAVHLEDQLDQTRAESRHSKEEAALELAKLRDAYEALQRSHEAEIRTMQDREAASITEQERRVSSMQAQLTSREAAHESNLAEAQKAARAEIERARLRSEAELADLRASISRLEVDLMRAKKARLDEVNALREANSKTLAEQTSQLKSSQTQCVELESQLEQSKSEKADIESKLQAAEELRSAAIESKDAVQAELDDLLMVFGDLEDKVGKYKVACWAPRFVVAMASNLEDHVTSSDESSSGADDGEWLDVEPDEEAVTVVSLFDDKTFSSLEEMLAYCQQQHGFDLKANLTRLQLDFIGAVKLINFIRDCVGRGQTLPSPITAQDIDSDELLRPTLDNDAVLFSLDDVLETISASEAESGGEQTVALQKRNAELEAELEAIRSSFANYRLTVQETLDRRWGDEQDGPDGSVKPSAQASSPPARNNSDYYFESYAFNDIHETMLKDRIRTDAYRDFIYNNKHLIKGKVVLDIGCGTGILSMFCAKAGAARVIAVDKSDIIDKARENIFNNGMSDVITCLRGAIEDVVLPVDQVDFIVSEWMGYCLLYEAMLPSVLYARDKYLKPDGLLIPSSATIWVAPIADPSYMADHITFWQDVYGFDMKAMQEGIYDEARIETMPGTSACGTAFPFKTLDLGSVKAEELVFTADWHSDLNRPVDSVDGFLIWFDNFFATSSDEPGPPPETTPDVWVAKKSGNVAFTTGPDGVETHWKQGLLLAEPRNPPLATPAGARVCGTITFKALEENARALTIDASWCVAGQPERRQSWKLK